MSHILHINSNYLTSYLHENLVGEIDKYGYSQTIFMPMKKEITSDIRFDSQFNVFNPIVFKNWHKFCFNYKAYLIDKRLNQLVNINNFQVIHAHSLFTDGNIAYKNSRKYSIPYIVTVREFTDKDFFNKRPYLRGKGQNILLNAKNIIFLTMKSKNLFLDHYYKNIKDDIEHKIEVLPNGIDKFWFENQYREKSMPRKDEPVKLLYVGRLMKSKNIAQIINALLLLNEKKERSFTLTVIGDAQDEKLKNELYKMSEHLPVIFKDRIEQKELIHEYRAHHIFVMPSIRESFGLVYLEAMSQGLPIIYSQTGGFYNTFSEGVVGFGVDPFSVEDMVCKTLKTLDNYETLSRQSLDSYTKFDWSEIGKDYRELYLKIFNNKDIKEY